MAGCNACNVCNVCDLLFDSGVPPRLAEDYGARICQVEAHAALERHEQDGSARLTKLSDLLVALAHVLQGAVGAVGTRVRGSGKAERKRRIVLSSDLRSGTPDCEKKNCADFPLA